MPAGTMLRTTWGQVDSTSLTDFSRVLTDNITSSQVVLWLLGQMGGIVTRYGKTIQESLLIEDNASVQWYSGYDPLSLANNEGITSAEYAWKQLAGTTQLSGLEKFQNSGSGQIIDLWDAKGQQLALTMRRKVNVAIPADGAADGGKQLVGLQSAIPFDPTSGIYGTLDSATNPNWRNFYCVNAATGELALTGTATSGPDAGDPLLGVANLFNGLRQGVVATTAGGDSLDVTLLTKKLYLKMLEGLEDKQQIVREVSRTDEAMANAGFKNIVYMGVPHTWDDDMLPNTNAIGSATAGQGAVGLNLDYAKCVFGEGYQFSFSDPVEPDNQDSTLMKCLAYTNMVFSNRRRHYRINFEFTP